MRVLDIFSLLVVIFVSLEIREADAQALRRPGAPNGAPLQPDVAPSSNPPEAGTPVSPANPPSTVAPPQDAATAPDAPAAADDPVVAPEAAGQTNRAAEDTAAEDTAAEDNGVVAPRTPGPPPNSLDYFQSGVALTSESLGSAADVCPESAVTPCILGPGGGLTIRAGYRSRGPWYVGGAYEFARLDSSNLLKLAILQQVRAEARVYKDFGTRLVPYLNAGLGGVLYGSEWGASTGGMVVSAGLGLEFQITQSTVVGFSPMYRALVLRSFRDSAGQQRAKEFFGFGLAHFVAIELVFEVREPLPRW
ncbi:MAG TPA: hypothetical protein VFQ61_29110 [Polyangiaceae bacterium]|nr:hypothetical protein [Polyangiaceae bacterium]